MILKILSYFILFVGSHASETRIVNGTDADDGEFPFAVSLRANNHHTCGATILSDQFVLTAAHCVCLNRTALNSKLFSIQYGSTNISSKRDRVIDVANITCHEFNREKLIYDVAVLRLSESLPRDDSSWSPVEISPQFNTSAEQQGVIIGWGKTSHGGPLSDKLQRLDVNIYSDAVCGVTYQMEHHVCFGANDAGACNGDSGTALLVDGVQVGIASFISAKCGIANKKHPNVYSRVATYYDWINSVTKL